MGSNHHNFLHPQIDNGHMEKNGVHTFEYTPLEDKDQHSKLIKDPTTTHGSRKSATTGTGN